MAKYTITHTCGHTSIEQIVGKESTRPARVAALEARACRDCERAQRSAALADAAADTGVELPALTGSDKQIAWATDLRAKRIAEVAAMPAGAGDENKPRVLAALAARTESRTWIDERDEQTMTVVVRIAKQLGLL